MASKTTPEALAHEITALERDINATERAGPSLDERIGAAVTKLEEAERFYRAHGLSAPLGGSAAQQRHFDKLVMIGALMAINRKQLVDVETTRVRTQFEANGGVGMTEVQRQQRLAALHGDLRKLQAQRELAWREQDGDDAFAARPGIDAEAGGLFLMSDADLQRIANGKEAAA
jgi:hypothetical protein